VGHWSQYRHRGRGSIATFPLAPPEFGVDWNADTSDFPELHVYSVTEKPGYADGIQFQQAAATAPGTILATASLNFFTEASFGPAWSDGQVVNVQARWTDGGRGVSAWSPVAGVTMVA